MGLGGVDMNLVVQLPVCWKVQLIKFAGTPDRPPWRPAQQLALTRPASPNSSKKSPGPPRAQLQWLCYASAAAAMQPTGGADDGGRRHAGTGDMAVAPVPIASCGPWRAAAITLTTVCKRGQSWVSYHQPASSCFVPRRDGVSDPYSAALASMLDARTDDIDASEVSTLLFHPIRCL
eukprot:COSAG01_NODE_995_length_12234_cov_3.196193_6_plen_177_part_00